MSYPAFFVFSCESDRETVPDVRVGSLSCLSLRKNSTLHLDSFLPEKVLPVLDANRALHDSRFLLDFIESNPYNNVDGLRPYSTDF
jgi:hypothetical protein